MKFIPIKVAIAQLMIIMTAAATTAAAAATASIAATSGLSRKLIKRLQIGLDYQKTAQISIRRL